MISRSAVVLGVLAVVSFSGTATAQPYARFGLSTDSIRIPGNTTFLVESNWTIEARVMFCSNLPGGNQFNVIYEEQYAGAEDKALDGNTTGIVGTAYPGSGPDYIQYLSAITADVWHHLAFVGDADEECLYVDGDKKVCRPRPMAIADDSRSYRSIGFFAEPFPGTSTRPSFRGLIDTLRIDRQRLYHANFMPPTGDLSPAGQTVLLYNFNESANPSMVIDESGYGYNGTPGATGENPTATEPTFGVCGCTPTCGDGCVDPGEECDDGNVDDGDCCSSTCQFEPASDPCAADGNVCTDDVCDGAGHCGVPNTGPCDDGGNVCTDDVCDGAGHCGVPNSDPCDDNDACTFPDVCSGGSCGGAPVVCDDFDQCTQDYCDSGIGCIFTIAPAGGCKSGDLTKLKIKNNADDNRDSIKWKWGKGELTTFGELGNPPASTQYTLCLYAGTGAATIRMPPGPRWTQISTKGFKYKDPSVLSDGAQTAKIKSGAAGKSKVLVKAKGTNIPDTLPPIPLPLPVTVQLVNSTNGTCFEAVYDSAEVLKNEGTLFTANKKQ